MRQKRTLAVGLACGVALGLGGIVALDSVSATARGQASGGFTLSAEQLGTNQRISQAAVRRSNRSLNYLAPIRTAQTDAADGGRRGVIPLGRIPGAGKGWAERQIADGAVSSAKIAPGAVTTDGLAAGAVAEPTLAAGAVGPRAVADGAIGEAALSLDVRDNLPLWGVKDVGASTTLLQSRGATSVERTSEGEFVMTFERDVSTCSYQATPQSYAGMPVATQAQVALDQLDESMRRIRIRLRGATGNPADSGFSMQVVC